MPGTGSDIIIDSEKAMSLTFDTRIFNNGKTNEYRNLLTFRLENENPYLGDSNDFINDFPHKICNHVNDRYFYFISDCNTGDDYQPDNKHLSGFGNFKTVLGSNLGGGSITILENTYFSDDLEKISTDCAIMVIIGH